MHGPVFGGAAFNNQCGYSSTSNPVRGVQVVIDGLPEPRGPKNVTQAKSEAQNLYNLGTAKDKKNERIIDEPRLGNGAFIDAALVPGLPGGTAEQLDAFTPQWHLRITWHTHDLLADNEITDAKQLLATAPS